MLYVSNNLLFYKEDSWHSGSVHDSPAVNVDYVQTLSAIISLNVFYNSYFFNDGAFIYFLLFVGPLADFSADVANTQWRLVADKLVLIRKTKR